MTRLILFLAFLYLLYKNKVSLKINNLIIIAIALVGFIFLINKETFALSTAIILDKNTLENDKVYSVGTIKPESQITTTNASINGGKDCLQFPTTVYKLAPIRDAVCSVPNGVTQAGVDAANIDTNYNIPDAGKKGYEIKFPDSCLSDANGEVCKDVLFSENGNFRLVLQQSDANLILYDTRTGGEVWKTQAIRSPSLGPFKMTMQGDGNLVIYDRNNAVIWASNTRNGDGPFRFAVQGDGNLVIYNKNGYITKDPAHKIWTR
jgi:outer membrane protein assembly factor BamB